MICPCSVPDRTSALKPDSVLCTQEAVGMPDMKFIRYSAENNTLAETGNIYRRLLLMNGELLIGSS